MMALTESIGRSDSMTMHTDVARTGRKARAKVLCAAGALSRTDKAVQRAHAIAAALDAQLLLLHVVDPAKPLRAARRRNALARAILDAHVRDLGSEGVETSIRSGLPLETIAKVAVEWDADLIVLGPYRKRFGDGLRGTTAERIARRADRPVLVVSQQSTRPYQHVLLTTDLSRMAVGIASVTRELGLLEHTRASVVHALEHTRNSMFCMAGVSKTEVGKYQQALRKLALAEIDVQLFSAGLQSERFAIFSPQIAPARAIEQVATHRACDLVVVGSSRFPVLKRVLFGSVSNEVLRRASQDVLLVTPDAARRARRRAAARERGQSQMREQSVQLH